MYLFILQRLCLESLLDILYFPVWWYSRGLLMVLKASGEWIKAGNRTLAPGLWLQNIFVPMYGQYDFTGKAISFFMRLVQVIFRSIALGFFGLGVFGIILIWIFWPPAVLWGFTASLFSPA